MRDPHVTALYYQASSAGIVEYRNPAPMSFENRFGHFDLTKDSLIFRPQEHFASEQETITAIEPFLKSWEIESDLTSNIGTIRFVFQKSEVIDRDPPKPGESVKGELRGSSKIILGLKAEATLVRSKFPNPPVNFEISPSIEMAYRRWLGFKNENEPLQSMAYFVLTILLDSAGGLKPAARTYNIEQAVLRKLSEISSTKGDSNTARKASAVSDELTNKERQWVEESVKKVIYQMGVHVSGLEPPKLKMSDLPSL